MKYSEKSTTEIGKDLVRGIFHDIYIAGNLAITILTAPIWIPIVAEKCRKEGAKKYKQDEENRGEPKNHSHHQFNLFHHSKNKENYDAPPRERHAPTNHYNHYSR